ncbi:MAG TPA: GTP cyclohydrolase I FolE [Alphaproteobacteria bacterium]|nr:GTP cyclohydrolase I FolE [Micavibrio sp.]MBK9562550.1 GTP cyclohydrolase I FolE [Micavibrio sp.]HQX26448.1 GTP cyclohydrolase I FolE [Alphaproteobacteria bacterium]
MTKEVSKEANTQQPCNSNRAIPRPSRAEAEKAVEILLRWAGEDPSRAGLIETPARVVRAYEEFFAGYAMDPSDELSKTFEDIKDFDDIVVVKDIEFVSHCEHHIAPIIGKAHVAYWPNEKIVGISKLARVVDIFAKRLVSQENMTGHIVKCIDQALSPKGTAVFIEADHQCMSIRGVNKPGSSTVTTTFSGIFKTDAEARERFLAMIGKK